MPLGKPLGGETRARPLDASALKAFAHPLRMQMYDYLRNHGSATATQLARHLGESTGQTSYHLRQLSRHSLVEDDHSRGSGRERWWKAASFSVDGFRLRQDPATAAAVELMMVTTIRQRSDALLAWLTRAETASEEWKYASVNNSRTLTLTPDELRSLNDEVMQLMVKYEALSDPREDDDARAREDGAERVRLYYDAFPLLPEKTEDETRLEGQVGGED